MYSILRQHFRILLLSVLSVALLFTAFILWNGSEYAHADLRAQIVAGMESCAALSEERAICLNQLAKDLLSKYSLRVIVAEFDGVIKPEDGAVFTECHVFGHYLGQQAYRETGSLGRVFEEGSYWCDGGIIHGAVEVYTVDSDIDPHDDASVALTLMEACAPYATTLPYAIYVFCVHGTGHAFMFITGDDGNRSLQLCDVFTGDETERCYDGVAMEYFMKMARDPYLAMSEGLEQPFYPCTDIPQKYRHACYTWYVIYLAEIHNYDYPSMIRACNAAPSDGREPCFQGVGRFTVSGAMNAARSVPQVMRPHEVCTLAGELVSPAAEQSCVERSAVAMVFLAEGNHEAIEQFCASHRGAMQRVCADTANMIIKSEWAASE